MNRPTIPEVFHRFAQYHRREPVWGSLHVVLEDGNYDSDCECCSEWARERGDREGEELARILQAMTPTQRGKLANLVFRYERDGTLPNWPQRPVAPDAGFLAAIAENPDDVANRLVYADWLDERDDPAAAGQRLAVALKEIIADPTNDAPRLNYADICERYGDRERGEFIKVQLEIAARFGVPADGSPVATGDREADAEEKRLRRRVRELLDANAWTAYELPCLSPWNRLIRGDTPHPENLHPQAYFCRGFVEHVTLTADNWLAHADALRATAPVRKVRLTGWHSASIQTALAQRWERAHPDKSIVGSLSSQLWGEVWEGIEFECLPDINWGRTNSSPLADFQAVYNRILDRRRPGHPATVEV